MAVAAIDDYRIPFGVNVNDLYRQRIAILESVAAGVTYLDSLGIGYGGGQHHRAGRLHGNIHKSFRCGSIKFDLHHRAVFPDKGDFPGQGFTISGEGHASSGSNSLTSRLACRRVSPSCSRLLTAFGAFLAASCFAFGRLRRLISRRIFSSCSFIDLCECFFKVFDLRFQDGGCFDVGED